MKILPYDSFTLVTPKTPDEIVSTLGPHVREPKLFRIYVGFMGKKPETPFEGKYDREGFTMWPAIRYRNSFRPVIFGRFEPHFAGTKIQIRQRLHFGVMAFLAVWIGLAGYIFYDFSSAGGLLRSGDQPFDPAFIGAAIFGFVYLMALGGFWWEARHTEAALSNILDARRDDGF